MNNRDQNDWEEGLSQLAEQISGVLLRRKLRMATAESCTGGWIAQFLTIFAGSSDWFEGGIVSYSNAMKQQILGVPEQVLEEHGAVSESVVLAMADGVTKITKTQLGVAVSGVAGPGGGSPEKPVGTVWLAVQLGGEAKARLHHFGGDRAAVRRQAVENALVLVAEMLEA